MALFGWAAGTQGAAGDSATLLPSSPALPIPELGRQGLALAAEGPSGRHEPSPSPLPERRHRPSLPRRAGWISSDSRYSGWGQVTFGVACFPGWSVKMWMWSPVPIAHWDVERLTFSSWGQNTPCIFFCSRCRGPRTPLYPTFSSEACLESLPFMISRSIQCRLLSNAFTVGQGFS